jgi:hypothetical protein
MTLMKVLKAVVVMLTLDHTVSVYQGPSHSLAVALLLHSLSSLLSA